MKNFGSINIKPQPKEPKESKESKEWEKAEILEWLNKELFSITWFENNNYSFLKDSPEDVSKLSEKYNTWEQFLNICKQELLNLA